MAPHLLSEHLVVQYADKVIMEFLPNNAKKTLLPTATLTEQLHQPSDSYFYTNEL